MLLKTEDLSDASLGSPPLEFPAWQMALKRAVDVLVAAVALIISLPLLLIISLVVLATSRGPVFFRWHVVGKGGQSFVGYKFRSMFDGADRAREQLQDKNEMTGVFFKMKNDPRITPIGRVLRRFSLDELPQFWSVLVGNMSLAGPRPCQVFEYEKLSDWQKQRTLVKPGLVSLWIVSGKSKDFNEMIRQDLYYVCNWSIWLDAKILMLAVPYVVLGKNQ